MNRQDVWENAKTAWGSLASHKLRSLLTTLGIVVGVATVVAIVSIIHGLNAAMAGQVESLGTDVIFVRAAEPQDNRPGSTERVRKLTHKDADLILRACPHVAHGALACRSYLVRKLCLGTDLREALLPKRAKRSFADLGSQAGAWEPG